MHQKLPPQRQRTLLNPASRPPSQLRGRIDEGRIPLGALLDAVRVVVVGEGVVEDQSRLISDLVVYEEILPFGEREGVGGVGRGARAGWGEAGVFVDLFGGGGGRFVGFLLGVVAFRAATDEAVRGGSFVL